MPFLRPGPALAPCLPLSSSLQPVAPQSSVAFCHILSLLRLAMWYRCDECLANILAMALQLMLLLQSLKLGFLAWTARVFLHTALA